MALTFYPPFNLKDISVTLGEAETDLYNVSTPGLPGNTFPVVKYGGNLYWLISAGGGNPVYFAMLQSTNGGVSWTELDHAGAPQRPAGWDTAIDGGMVFDGNHTITICFVSAFPNANPLVFYDFNLQTGTWGAAYGTSPANDASTNGAIFKLTNGTTAVFKNRTVTGGVIAGITLSWWTGSSWSSANIDGNMPASTVANPVGSIVYDPNGGGAAGIFHVFGRYIDPLGSGNPALYGAFYQRVDAATGALSTFVNLTSLTSSGPSGLTPGQCNPPLIVNGQLVYGAIDPTGNFPIVLVGTPLTAPVFTASGSIDDYFTDGSQGNLFAPALASDGLNLYALMADDANELIRLGYTSMLSDPGIGWISQTVQTNVDVSLSYPSLWAYGPGLLAAGGTDGGSTGGTTGDLMLWMSQGQGSFAAVMLGVKRFPKGKPAEECPPATVAPSPWGRRR